MKPASKFVGNWKSRITAHLFNLNYDNPEVFVQCQWQTGGGVSLPYLLYRIFLAATFFGILVSSMCEFPKEGTNIERSDPLYDVSTAADAETSSENIFLLEQNKTEQNIAVSGLSYLAKWPIYLTNWGIITCTAQAVLAVIITLQKKFSSKIGNSEMRKMPLLYKCYWALHTVACVIAPAITVLYWALVYRSEKGPPSAVGILVHGINSVLMFVDLALVAHPYRLHHFYLPVMMAVIYSIFTFIYFQAGGTDRHQSTKIYPHLDWSKPWTLALPTLLGAFILVLIIHSSVYGLSFLRSYVGQRLKSTRGVQNSQGEENRGANLGEHGFDVIDRNGFSISKDSISTVIIMN